MHNRSDIKSKQKKGLTEKILYQNLNSKKEMNFKCFAFCLILATLTSALSPSWVSKGLLSEFHGSDRAIVGSESPTEVT